jgi:hypothetical protein
MLCICANGYYLASDNKTCVDCVRGMDCAQPGVTVSTLPLQPGSD